MTAVARSLDKLHRAKMANVRKANQFWAHPEDLHEMEGFNPRNYERAELQEHIRNLTEEQINEMAEIVGKTPQHVKMTLEMHTMPDEIKALVEEQVVSATLALKTYNEYGTAAIEMLKEGVDEVLRAGKTKLTQKGLDNSQAAAKGSPKPKAKAIPKEVSYES